MNENKTNVNRGLAEDEPKKIIKNYLRTKLDEVEKKTFSNRFQRIRGWSEKRFIQEELRKF